MWGDDDPHGVINRTLAEARLRRKGGGGTGTTRTNVTTLSIVRGLPSCNTHSIMIEYQHIHATERQVWVTEPSAVGCSRWHEGTWVVMMMMMMRQRKRKGDGRSSPCHHHHHHRSRVS